MLQIPWYDWVTFWDCTRQSVQNVHIRRAGDPKVVIIFHPTQVATSLYHHRRRHRYPSPL